MSPKRVLVSLMAAAVVVVLVLVGTLAPVSSALAADSTWEAQTSGTTANLKGVFFLDANRGWAVGDGGVILATTDGGRSWNKQTSATTAALSRVCFADQNSGWAVGGGTGRPVVLKSSNGGGTWGPYQLPPHRGATSM